MQQGKSKFWGGGSDSETDDEKDEELSGGDFDSGSESEAEENEEAGESKFKFSDTDSGSDDERKGPVKTKTAKVYDEMNLNLDRLRLHIKNREWDKILAEFQALNAWYVAPKTKQVVAKDGVPGPYVALLCNLEDLLAEVSDKGDKEDKEDKEEEKATKKAATKLSKTKSKALNTLKQRLPKHNKGFADEIKRYREDPGSFPVPGTIGAWGDEASDEEPETPEQPETKPAGSEDWQTVPARPAGGARKTGPKPPTPAEKEKIEWDDKKIEERLTEIQRHFGRSKTDKKLQLVDLRELLAHVKGKQLKVAIHKQIIATMLGVTSAHLTKHMKPELWNSARNNILDLLKLLVSDSSLTEADNEVLETAEESTTIRAFVEQLDAEFTKSMQNIDPHTHEYVDRLRDESSILELAALVQNYYQSIGKMDQAARMAMKRVEHLYYKLDSLSEKFEEAHQERQDKQKKDLVSEVTLAEATPKETEDEEGKARSANTSADMEQLCVLIYNHGDEMLRIRAMLCRVYHHAMHDRYHEARDMLLATHIQDNIHRADVSTQILFNRAMVQLGLCAFRGGSISETHSCLSDICSGRTREFLAQGITVHRGYQEKNAEQQKLEKQRQVPYHMHLNLELLEAVHLISAMLLEVPYMASHPFDVKPKPISRSFRKLLDQENRQVFTGPPENTREFVVTAAKALQKGDWKRCEELLLNLPVWDLLSGVDQVKAMLRGKIQEAGLRTYLFTYSKYYDSLNLDSLCHMFDLTRANAHSLVCKMMFNDELHASWDQPTGAIIMHNVEPSRLQYLALQFAEKVGTSVENNERILDVRTGAYGFKYETAKAQKGYGHRGGFYAARGGRGGDSRERPFTTSDRSDRRGGEGERRGEGGSGRRGGEKGEGKYGSQSAQHQRRSAQHGAGGGGSSGGRGQSFTKRGWGTVQRGGSSGGGAKERPPQNTKAGY